MSSWFSARNIAIVAAVGAGVYLFPRTAAKANALPNVFETPGVKNIGDRYSAGGGSDTHQPGAATPRGNADNTVSPQQSPRGIDTPAFQKSHADQKMNEPGVAGKAFHNAQYGPNNEKGK